MYIGNKRSAGLADVRAIVDDVQMVCATIRQSYPERYPVPPEVDAMLNLEAAVIHRARSGGLQRVDDQQVFKS